MKRTTYAIAIGALFLLAGCKDNPVAPSSPAPLPTVARLNASALTLFNQGKDAVTAATVLKSEYRFGIDTLSSALYSAGYTPQDLVKALKVVFEEPPHVCEGVMLHINVRISQDGIADIILRIYVDSLSQQTDELTYFLQKLRSFDKSVGILDSLYAFVPQDIMKLLYAFSPDITGIVTSVHKYYPALTEKDYVLVMWQLKCSALDASKALQAISTKSAADIAALLKSAGYEISDVMKAIRSVYRADSVQLATILDQFGYQMAEAIEILNSCAFSLNELAGLLKNHYNQTAAQAAGLLNQFASDLPSLGSALKSQFALSDTELSLIVINLGHNLPDIVIMLKGMGDPAADVIKVLQAISTKSQAEVATLLRDGGYQITDVLLALRAVYSASNMQIADILDQLGYTLGDALGILKDIGCGIDELAGILKDHYGQAASQAAGYLKQLNADLPTIANAIKNHYSLAFADIAFILKNLGGQIRDIAPILLSWSESVQDTIADLKSIGFSTCDVMHYFNLPC